ncbi:hypothetical protein BDQ12DRAFT_236272 [Crucibulum laeve]|uniref:Ubiquinone biosynthesis protein n=1 Tax=Crucibulum laeve TaxID=68775 RepID=A0A5C3LV83_9AGAR|nr:hypothetical protein BDQ12DRAFT_236272 [Crucibulum laeve]
MAASSSRLLKAALPLVRTHGFTREALAQSVLALPPTEAHTEPLSETAVSALFGNGDNARRTLINAWLDGGLQEIRSYTSAKPTVRDLLQKRLEYNEPVLRYLPEAFALLASPQSGLPPLDPRPALKHSARIADEVAYTSGDNSLQLEWYARRASLATVYTAAELHQFTSPSTAYAFLDSLLDTSSAVKSSIDEVSLFSSYIFKSWKGIIKSSGILS